MTEEIGDLSDLILDVNLLDHAKNLDKKVKSIFYNKCKQEICSSLFILLFGNVNYKDKELKRLNELLAGRLKRVYSENGRCYIEISEGKSDLYSILDVNAELGNNEVIV